MYSYEGVCAYALISKISKKSKDAQSSLSGGMTLVVATDTDGGPSGRGLGTCLRRWFQKGR